MKFLEIFWPIFGPLPPLGPQGGAHGEPIGPPPMGAHAAAEGRAVGAGGGRRGRAARPGSL